MSDEREEQSEAKASTPSERRVRALPVVALCVLLLTAALAIYAGRREPTEANGAQRASGAAPTPVRDVDHYVEGTPGFVAERFLRAWMRQQYATARDLSYGALRDRCEQRARELEALSGEQRAEIERTKVFTAATHYDLEHVETRDLPPDEQGRPRKEVRGQGHARGAYAGFRVDARRGQTFVLVRVEGRWLVAERMWERGAHERDEQDAGAL
jgi:hypothetical protein